LFEPAPAPGVAGFFLEKGRIAKVAHGGVAGVLRTHAGGEVLSDLLIEMELDFVLKLLIPSVAPEEGLEPKPELPSPDHNGYSYVVCTTRLIAADKRLQFAASFSSCARPAEVNE